MDRCSSLQVAHIGSVDENTEGRWAKTLPKAAPGRGGGSGLSPGVQWADAPLKEDAGSFRLQAQRKQSKVLSAGAAQTCLPGSPVPGKQEARAALGHTVAVVVGGRGISQH